MSLIRISRRKKNNKISKTEFKLTSILLDAFETEIDETYSIIIENSPIYCGDRELAYSEHYSSLSTEIPKNKIVFRPIWNERHSNILIEMFEELQYNKDLVERLEIKEYENKNGKKRYSGYFITSDNKIIEQSKVKNFPSITTLKTAIIAKLMLSECEYEKFSTNLKDLAFTGDGSNV